MKWKTAALPGNLQLACNSFDQAKPRVGFTLIELCVTLAIVAAIAAVVIGGLGRAATRAKSICCNCNLKQIGLAFRTWALDHTNLYPMGVATTFGGTLEYLTTGETFRHFQVMSNELSTPFILVCPQDVRIPLKSFTQGFANSNLSYFAGIVTNDESPQMFLSGDRFLTGGTRLPAGIVEFTTNDFPAWKPGLHGGHGNIALADGSVEGLSTMGLRAALKNTGIATNRLAMP